MEGRIFHVLTGHKPLTFTLSSNSEQHTQRQICHLDYISQFTSDIRYVSGTQNAALSRISVNSLNDKILGRWQKSRCKMKSSITLRSSSSLIFKDIRIPWSCVILPQEHRTPSYCQSFAIQYFIPGIRAMERLITARYVWPGINMDVCKWIKTRIHCQKCKVQQQLHHCLPSIQQMPDLTLFTLILLAHFHHLRDIHIYLCLLIISLVGHKPSPSQHYIRNWQVPLSVVGSQDFVYHLQ